MNRTGMAMLALGIALFNGCGSKSAPVDAGAPVAKAPRPRLGFHLSDAEAEKPAARTTVKGEPMTAEATEELLGRLPKLASTSEGAVSFALRSASAPVPRPGRTVDEPFPPKPSSAPKPAVVAGKLTVTRKAPEGSISTAPNLSVTFSEPMVELATVRALAATAPPIELTPEPKGTFRWLGTQTLVFQPEKQFPKATAYTVVVPAGTKSLAGSVLQAAERFTFSTMPPKLVSQSPEGTSVTTDPVFVAELDQRMDAAAVLPLVDIRANGRRVPARAATAAEIAAEDDLPERLADLEKKGKGRTLVFKAKERIAPAAHVTVTLPVGTPSSEGTLRTTEAQSWSFDTYGPMEARAGTCYGTCNASSVFEIEFTNRIDRELFDKSLVTVTPAVEGMNASVAYSGIRVQARWKANTQYRVTVAKGVPDIFGQTSAAAHVRELTVLPYEPRLFAEDQPMTVADPGSGPRLSVLSTNERAVRVRLYQVRPEDWAAYLTFRAKWDEKQETVAPPGRLISDGEVKLDAKLDDTTLTSIDLAPALSNGLGHVVAVVETTRPTKDREAKQWIRKWMQFTHIGVSAREGRDGSLSLLATGLDHAEPLEGVTFAVLGTISAISATSGKDGIARIAGPLGPYPDPTSGQRHGGLLVASRGGESTFVPGLIGNAGAPGETLRLFAFDGRQIYKPGETVRVKGIVRRVGLQRGGDVGLPKELLGKTIHWKAADARAAEIAKGTTTVDDAGGLFVSFPLKSNVNLGSASVTFDGPGFSGSEGFEVQEFRRPEYEVAASTDGAPFFVGESGVARVSASYFAGGGLGGATATWTVSRSEGHFTPPNRSGYHFGNGQEGRGYYRGEDWALRGKEPTSATWEGRTDASGTHRLRVAFDGTDDPYPMTLSASARITDLNGQAWTTQTTMLVHPARVYAGLAESKPFVRAGDAIALDVVASDLEGNLVAGRKVHVRSYREEAEEVRGKWVTKQLDEATCDVTTTGAPAPKACSLATKGAGQYTIVADVVDEQGKKSRTRFAVWASGAGAASGDRPGVDRALRSRPLGLTLDKTEYAPGDTAEILVKAPFAPAEGMLEVTGGRELREIRVHLTERTQTLSLPVLPGDVPGLRVSLGIVGTQPRLDEHGDVDPTLVAKPAFAQASISLSVPPKEKDIRVVAVPRAKALLPGGANAVVVDTKDATGSPYASEVAVVVVDEAVLALSGYTMDDAKRTFYTPVGQPRAYRDSRSYVALAPREQVQRFFGDGPNAPSAPWGREESPDDMDGERDGRYRSAFDEAQEFGMIGLLKTADAAPAKGTVTIAEVNLEEATPDQTARPRPRPIALRSKFDALAVFAARVKTDAAGHAEVPLTMPESTSRFRIMVVAWDKESRFGYGESTITTRQPLTVRPSPPRFLNYGDRFELPVIVQNQTDRAVHVSLAARGVNATLLERTGRAFEVAAGDRVEVRLPAAAHLPGKAHFQIATGTADFADAADVVLPVWTPGTTEAFASYGVLDEGAVGQAVALPDGVEPSFGGLDISTASTALFGLSDALLYLTRSPYDGSEQLASRILAIASLREVLDAFHGGELPAPAALDAIVAKDLATLQSRQNPSTGGFGSWSNDPWPYLSVHVAFALSMAKQKGYPVSTEMLGRAEGYLQNIDNRIPAYYSPEARRTLRAFALFVQKRLGHPHADVAQGLVNEAGGVAKTPLETLAWLLPTVAGTPLGSEIAKHFENRAVETAGSVHFTTSYGESDYLVLGSDHRTDALVLAALVETQPGNVLIPRIVAGLLGSRKGGHWQGSQDDAFVLMALDAYFQRFETTTPNFVARVWLGDRTASEHAFKGHDTDRVGTEVPMSELLKLGKSDLVVQKEGKGRLYYRLGLRYAPSDMALPPLERGFSVTRRYEAVDAPTDISQDPQGTWHVKAGATVRVRVTMVAPAERHHVALVDPMPAAFEALNPALRGTGPLPQDDTKRTSDWYWARSWYEHDNLRDERAEAFASLLWAGAHEYVYTARATTPGNFVVPPAKAEEMYAPETFGRSGADRVVVE